jgi:hypothetical protein
MLLPVTWFLLLSPDVLVEGAVKLSIDRNVFPKGADNWDRIGLFKLKDGGEDRLVLLYYYDSDSVASKKEREGRYRGRFYPNSFGVHAVYQTAPGKWAYKEVFGYTRVGFIRVAKAAPDYLLLECRSKFIGRGVNKSFTERVSFLDGMLTATPGGPRPSRPRTDRW